MGIGVLGPLAVDGRAAGLAPRDRVVLVALTLRPGELVTADQLADALWPESPPASWNKVVQGCVMRLRRVLGADAIETLPRGYRLAVPVSEVDACEFERLLARGREQLALGEPERAAYTFGEGLALWRGPALVDLDGWDAGRVAAGRLEELRRDAEELRVDAVLRTGRHREVLAEAQALVETAPLRERRWELLALAQYRAGRQGDALRTLRRLRTVLLEELGLDPGHTVMALEEAILRQDPALSADAATPETSSTCPYPGLVAYDVEDADGFFGRDTDTAACLQRLAGAGVLAVVGPSGSGKSSLVRAGVAAALRREGRRVVVITPGARPMDALTSLPGSGRPVVLVVDQGEEAVSLCEDPAERAGFFAALSAHAAKGRLVIALRADRLGDLARYPDIARLVERGLYLLNPMNEAGLRAAIEGPARQAGLRLEPGLVELLMREIEGEPGALPLLAHALHQTWRRREGPVLTVEGYRATGGIRHAVAQSAESLYEQLPTERRSMLRDLLLRLVVADPEGEPVRSRLPRKVVASDTQRAQLVDLLVDARLLTSDDGVVEIAHEAIARAWPRLRGWLDDDAEGQRILRHVAVAADTWQDMGRPTAELYRGARLARALDWRRQAGPDLTPLEQAFLDAGQRLAEEEEQTAAQRARAQARVNRRLRGLLAGTAFLLVVAAVAGTLAVRQANRATDATRSADARRVAAQSLVAERPDHALLLALAALGVDPSSGSREALLSALARSPQLSAFRPLDGACQLDAGDGAGMIAAVDAANRLSVYRADGVTPIGTYDPYPRGWDLEIGCIPGSVAVSPSGRLAALAVLNLGDVGVRLVDLRSVTPTARQLGGIPDHVQTRSMSFSEDGRFFAMTLEWFAPGPSSLGTWAYVWRTTTPGRPLQRIRLVGESQNQHAELSPDGRLLYTVPGLFSDIPPEGIVYDVATGRRVRSLGRLGYPMDLSPDGDTIAYADGADVVLAASSDGHSLHRLNGPGGAITRVRFSPRGGRVAAVSGDRTAIVWDAGSGARLEQVVAASGTVGDLAFSADGHHLYTVDDTGLRSFDLRGDDRYIRRLARADARQHPVGFTSRFLSPDGDTIAVSTWDPKAQTNRLAVIDRDSGRRIEQPGEAWADTRLTTPAWSSDGRLLAFVNVDGTLRVLDWRRAKVVAQRPAGSGATLAYLGDGTRLLAHLPGGIAVLDADSLVLLTRPVGVPGRETAFAIPGPADGPDDTAFLFTANQRGDFFDFFSVARRWALVNLRTGAVEREGVLPFPVASAALSPDGKRLAAAGADGFVMIDVATGETRTPPAVGTDVEAEGRYLSFSSDGDLLLSADTTGRVTLRDGRDGTALGTVRPEDSAAVPFFLPDSHTVLIPSFDGSLHAWDTTVTHAVEFACRIVGRSLSRTEWSSVLPNQPYHASCP